MNYRRYRRSVLRSAVIGVVAGLAVACSAHQSADQAPQASSMAKSLAKIASLVDTRWMGFDTGGPWNWEYIERESQGPRHCQGCGLNAPTAEVKVYAPSKFDAAAAPIGQQVDMDGRPGFFLPMGDHTSPGKKDGYFDAILTWQYADDAWASVRGMSTMTSEVDRLQELARALRPAQRTPIRVPLRMSNVPTGMPLSAIDTRYVPIGGGAPYGTTLSFAQCAYVGKGDDCTKTLQTAGSMSVLIWPRDDYDHSFDSVRHYVERKIGGRDGRYDEAAGWAGVLVQKGMYVEFGASPPGGAEPNARKFEDMLDSVVWAPDPGNEATWSVVDDWAKQ